MHKPTFFVLTMIILFATCMRGDTALFFSSKTDDPAKAEPDSSKSESAINRRLPSIEDCQPFNIETASYIHEGRARASNAAAPVSETTSEG
jgi:hypothetical protein